MTAILKLFDILPGWCWAAALALAMLGAGVQAARLGIVTKQRDTARAEAGQMRAGIEAQKAEAEQKLKALTAQRDAAQHKVDEAAVAAKTAKEEFDNALQKSRSTPAQPVVVRVRSACPPAGGGGGSAQGAAAAQGSGRDGPDGAALRLLPDANSERLERALTDIELLSRDFNTARAERDLCYAQPGAQ